MTTWGRRGAARTLIEKVSDNLRALQEQCHHAARRAVPNSEEDHLGRRTVEDAELEEVLVTSEEH